MRKPFLFLAILTLAIPALAAEPHPFIVRDLVTMKRISDPQASPKGDRIAFVLRSTDLAANKGRYDLWMVNADGSGLIQLTTDPASDDNPRWAPDGQSLFFLSSRSGSKQARGTRSTCRAVWRPTSPRARSAARRNSPSRRTAARWCSRPAWPAARSPGRPTSISTARRRTARRPPAI